MSRATKSRGAFSTTTSFFLWMLSLKNYRSAMEYGKAQQAVQRQRRNLGIDALRYVCAAGVILFHALPSEPPVPFWAKVMGAACVPVIPFFFITSGYFLPHQERFSLGLILKPFSRLLPIYLFWMIAYYLLLQLLPVTTWSFSPRDLLWGGTAFHLWFLPALAFALAFVATGLSIVGPRLTGLACILLAGVALGFGAYHDVLGLPGHPIIHTGQLAGPAYVYVGAMLARRPVTVAWQWCAVVVVLAYCAILAEGHLIAWWINEPSRLSHDVLGSTFIMGAALFMMARAVPETWLTRSLAHFSRASLGVYAVHLFLLWLIIPVIGNESPWHVIVATIFVLFVSTILIFGMQRIRWLRPYTT